MSFHQLSKSYISPWHNVAKTLAKDNKSITSPSKKRPQIRYGDFDEYYDTFHNAQIAYKSRINVNQKEHVYAKPTFFVVITTTDPKDNFKDDQYMEQRSMFIFKDKSEFNPKNVSNLKKLYEYDVDKKYRLDSIQCGTSKELKERFNNYSGSSYFITSANHIPLLAGSAYVSDAARKVLLQKFFYNGKNNCQLAM